MKRLLALILFLTASSGFAEVRLPAIISDHMVVQAGVEVPIWGWADAGESVSVTLADQTATTTTAKDGKWSVKLGKMSATAKPQTLTVKGKTTLTAKDVLIGEVWLASGQSNMEFRFSRGEYPPAESAAAALPQVRMFTVVKNSTRIPQTECEGSWVVATPETVQDFSAVAYYFGRDLNQKLNTPVGMINSSWGGTDIAAWTSEDAQLEVPALKAQLEDWAKASASYDAAKEKEIYNKKLVAWNAAVTKAKAAGAAKMPSKPRAVGRPDINQNHPANLFNGMINPLIPYAIHGVIWYQGEHNCSTATKAELYATQLPLLVKNWRSKWRVNFPFAWVQLPNFEQNSFRPLVREAMLKSLSVPNTGMAVTIDVGMPNDNHPKDKKTVGERLSLWALARVYKQKVPAYSGPTPLSHEVKDGGILVKFNHTEGNLKAKGDALKGFEIAGADQQFKPAQTKIIGGQILVTHPDIKTPAAVRYNWAANPEGNLYNGAGLPASPFRTDDWKITEPTH